MNADPYIPTQRWITTDGEYVDLPLGETAPEGYELFVYSGYVEAWMTNSRVGDVIKAVLEVSALEYVEARPLLLTGSVCHGGWTVNVGTNDPLEVTEELRTQLKALIACASANGYQIGQTFTKVRIKRKVNKAAQKFVRELSEPPRGLRSWLPAIDASLKSLYKDMQTAMYAEQPLHGMITKDRPFFGVDRSPVGSLPVGLSALTGYKVP